jgi:hypothetical protein
MLSILDASMLFAASPGLGTAALTDRAPDVLWLAAGWALMTSPLNAAALQLNKPTRAAGGTGEQNVVRVR